MTSEFVTVLLLPMATGGQAAPAAAGSDRGISMELTRTEHSDAVISLAEIATPVNIPKGARKL